MFSVIYVEGRKKYKLLLVSATCEKKRVLLPPLCRIHLPVEKDELLFAPLQTQSVSVETRIDEHMCGPLLHPWFVQGHDRNIPLAIPHGVRFVCVVRLLIGISHCDGFSGAILMRTPSRRFAWERRLASTVLWSFLVALVFQALVNR